MKGFSCSDALIVIKPKNRQMSMDLQEKHVG